MRKAIRLLVSGVAVGVVCLGMAAQASAVALTQASPEYMGLILDGIPVGQEPTFVNTLNDLAPNTGPTQILTETYTRSSNVLCYNTCPNVTTNISDSASNSVSLFGAGTFYLVAKYDAGQAGSLVWYVTAGSYTVPQNFGTCGSMGCGLSGLRVYTGTNPPDGGPSDVVPEPASLLLLGAGLSAAAVKARRRIAAARA